MKLKVLVFLLICTSLIGYLEWGGNNKMFLFQAEGDIIYKLFTNPRSVIHPFILLPMLGQVLLGFALFQNKPNKKLIYSGIACLGLLLGFMFLIGLFSLNFKIVLSTLPFVLTAIFTIFQLRKVNSK